MRVREKYEMKKEQFELIKKEYGMYSSFCVWGDTKSDLSIFDKEETLKDLHVDVIFLGINISRPLEKAFANFHDGRRGSQDGNLMNAVKETKYYGSYITDLYKDYVEVDGASALSHFKNHPEEEKDQFDRLYQEIITVCGDITPRFVLLKRDKQFEKAFLRFCEHLGVNYQYMMTRHYAYGGTKEIKKDLENN